MTKMADYVELVRSERRHAYISDITSLTILAQSDCDKIKLLDEMFNVASFAFVVQKGVSEQI